MRPVARLVMLCAVVVLGLTTGVLAWTPQGGFHQFGPGGAPMQPHASPPSHAHPQSFHHPWHGPHPYHWSPAWRFGYVPAYPYRYYAPAFPYAYPYAYRYSYPYSYSYSYPYSYPYYGSYSGSYMSWFGSTGLGAPSSFDDRDTYAGDDGGEPPATRAADGSWFYCRALREYYPDVKRCPEPWLEVPPTPQNR